MSIIHLPNGIGDTLGDTLVTTSPLEVNGNVWYVHYDTGTDAASPAGQNRQAPLKTLGQANTNAASGDIIVLMDGHEETFTAAVTVSKDLTIVGAGSSGGYPTVKLTNNQAAASMLVLSCNSITQLRNIWFEEEAQANSSVKISRVSAGGTGILIVDNCYVQCGQYDDNFALSVGDGDFCMIRNSTFVSTATSIATQPVGAMCVDTAATSIRAIFMDGVVVDGGVYGWSNFHAVEWSQNANDKPTVVNIINTSLLRGSDMRIDKDTIGWVNVSTKTGGVRIDWDGV